MVLRFLSSHLRDRPLEDLSVLVDLLAEHLLRLPRALAHSFEVRLEPGPEPGGNCIKTGLPGKLILRDYFQENMTSRRPFLLLRISFPGRPIFIQLPPGM